MNNKKEESTYEKLKRIKNRDDLIFTLAVTWMLEIGAKRASEIKEEEIENAKIPMFDDEYAKELYRATKELGEIGKENSADILKFIQVEKPFNTIDFKPRKRR